MDSDPARPSPTPTVPDAGGAAVPPEPGALPNGREPDPAPERDELRIPDDGGERTELGEPVGADTIREGRVNGVMGAPLAQHGQGQGG